MGEIPPSSPVYVMNMNNHNHNPDSGRVLTESDKQRASRYL